MMKPYLLLALAIICEIAGTTSLKASNGFTKPIPVVLLIVAYVLSFWDDTFACYKLDGVGRSLVHLTKILAQLKSGRALPDHRGRLTIKGSTGRLVLHSIGAIAALERTLILERTMAGLKPRGLRAPRAAAGGRWPRLTSCGPRSCWPLPT